MRDQRGRKCLFPIPPSMTGIQGRRSPILPSVSVSQSLKSPYISACWRWESELRQKASHLTRINDDVDVVIETFDATDAFQQRGREEGETECSMWIGNRFSPNQLGLHFSCRDHITSWAIGKRWKGGWRENVDWIKVVSISHQHSYSITRNAEKERRWMTKVGGQETRRKVVSLGGLSRDTRSGRRWRLQTNYIIRFPSFLWWSGSNFITLHTTHTSQENNVAKMDDCCLEGRERWRPAAVVSLPPVALDW